MTQPPAISMNDNPNHVCNSNRTLNIAILNSQSLVNKVATFGAFVNVHDPDIIANCFRNVTLTWHF